tara:strand:- start:987 stop:1505 length:519 start_codon:yes stop_codon:yes gene_type:complete
MKKNIQKLILLFSACILFSCSERHSFTDKENLNLILNDLFLGDFYSCILKPEQKEKSGYQVNRNINLIYTKKIVGLIYRSDKWDHGNSIFVKNDKKQSEYYLGSFYADDDFKKNLVNKDHKVIFINNILKVNLFNQLNHNEYKCRKLKKILSEAMKKEILKNFLLQKNADRS